MPRGERDYSKAKVYAIVCNTTGERYIGATCKTYLSQRLSEHRSTYKNWKEGKGQWFYSSFPILERENYDIILLEEFPCNTKDQLHARERFHIESSECVNKNIPIRYAEEKTLIDKLRKDPVLEKQRKHQWWVENRERVRDSRRAYAHTNRERIAEKQKEKISCGCGSEVRRGDIARHLKSQKHKSWEEENEKE